MWSTRDQTDNSPMHQRDSEQAWLTKNNMYYFYYILWKEIYFSVRMHIL